MCDFSQEPLEEGLAVGSVSDFGVVLNTINSTVGVFDDRCWGVDSGGTNSEPLGGFGNSVEVRHPHDVSSGNPVGQQLGRFAGERKLGPAVFSASTAIDSSSQLMGDELGAVTDSEDGNFEFIDVGVYEGSPIGMD
jgi:hypothetical protein